MSSSFADLRKWYDRDLGRFAPFESSTGFHQASGGPVLPVQSFTIFTSTNSYTIRAREKGSDGEGYLSCSSQSRKHRAGEDWFRGSDLPDGPFDEETWHKILANIVGYELVHVHNPEHALKAAELPASANVGPDRSNSP